MQLFLISLPFYKFNLIQLLLRKTVCFVTIGFIDIHNDIKFHALI